MRKKIALSLIVTLLLSVVLNPVESLPAYASDHAKQIINAIGIMDTDQGSNEAETIVTRARFAQMLVNLSSLNSTVSAESSVSIFNDVKKNYWAAGYIETAVKQGWMSGYLNGKFKPGQGITLQEAVYGIVKLLGYTSSDFSGGLSSSIMKLYQSKELNTNIKKTKAQYLTVNDCYNLFYNTLIATTKDGTVYGTKLGYTVDSDGAIDYLSIVNTKLNGPVIADSNWRNEITFYSQATYYKEGSKSSLSEVGDHDVLYYAESQKTIWIYDNKVSGTLTSINPDYSAPKSVTVSSKTYEFASSDAAIKFSSMGTVKEGDIITLILDKDDKVVDVLNLDEYNAAVTGVVIGNGTHTALVDGTYEITAYITLVDASGNEYQQDYDNTSSSFATGDVVRVNYSGGTGTASKVSLTSTSIGDNTFSSDGSRLGYLDLASSVKILDFNGSSYINIHSQRLAGVTLPTDGVYYYELNTNGEISKLILNDITGDMDKYGIYSGISAQNSKMNYNYLIGSTSASLSTDSISVLSSIVGPTHFVFSNNVLKKSYALTGVDVLALGSTTIQSGSAKYILADDYSVYLLVDNEYVSTTIDKVSDLSKYSLKAYYDKLPSAGGRIRVIVAESK